jgi:hypothetical protein
MFTMRAHGQVACAAIAVAIASCAAPSRQLTTRIVEDPITLPRRMASASLSVTGIHYEPTNTQGVFGTPGLRFGITDHLEWVDLLGLRYAFLDDRPVDGRAPMPFSLALRAGAFGIGYSSTEGMIVLPVVSLEALKHVGDRWALSLWSEWRAQWVAHAAGWFTPTFNDALFYSARRFSFLSLGASATRQLSDRVALGIAPSVERATSCVSPTCDWKWRSASVSVFLGVRPLSWLTVHVAPQVGVRERADIPQPATYPDGTPVPIRPLSVTWVALTGTLAFYW